MRVQHAEYKPDRSVLTTGDAMLNVKFTRRLFAAVLLLVGTGLGAPKPVEAAVNKNIFLIADGTPRVKTMYFRDLAPNDSLCSDDSVYGALEFTYVANNTSFTIKKLRYYQSTSMTLPMTVSDLTVRVGNNIVRNGWPYMSPSNTISPGRWATVTTINGTTLEFPAIGWNNSPQGSTHLDKTDPTGGTFWCDGDWTFAFFKQ